MGIFGLDKFCGAGFLSESQIAGLQDEREDGRKSADAGMGGFVPTYFTTESGFDSDGALEQTFSCQPAGAFIGKDQYLEDAGQVAG